MGDGMDKPTFLGIWNKNLSLGDRKTGCLIQPPASALSVSLVEGTETPLSHLSEISW